MKFLNNLLLIFCRTFSNTSLQPQILLLTLGWLTLPLKTCFPFPSISCQGFYYFPFTRQVAESGWWVGGVNTELNTVVIINYRHIYRHHLLLLLVSPPTYHFNPFNWSLESLFHITDEVITGERSLNNVDTDCPAV